MQGSLFIICKVDSSAIPALLSRPRGSGLAFVATITVLDSFRGNTPFPLSLFYPPVRPQSVTWSLLCPLESPIESWLALIPSNSAV